MRLNILELVILAAALLFGAAGWRKGFVKKLASMLSLVLSIALVSFLLPYVTEFIKENTPVYDVIAKRCEQMLEEQMEPWAVGGDGSPGAGVGLASGLTLTRADQTELIEGLPLPEALRDKMLDYNNDEGYRRLGVTGFADYVVHYVATVLLNILAFLIAVIVVHILLRIVLAILNIVTHIPVLRFVNRLLGLALGLVQALLLVWLFFLVLTMATGTEWGLNLLGLVQQSPALSALYDCNLLQAAVLHAVSSFL